MVINTQEPIVVRSIQSRGEGLSTPYRNQRVVSMSASIFVSVVLSFESICQMLFQTQRRLSFESTSQIL